MDAAIEAVTVIHLAIDMHPAARITQHHRHAELRRGIALGIAAIGHAGLAAQRVAGGGGFGDEVDQTADFARAINGRWRPAQDLDPGRVAERGGIGAAVLGPLEATEIVFGQGAAQRHRAFDAVIAGGIGRWCDGGQVIDAGDAIAGHGGVADQGQAARGFDQRLVQPEGGRVAAGLQQMHGIAGHRDRFHILRTRRYGSRQRGEPRPNNQSHSHSAYIVISGRNAM